jgi:hypothetical protein
MWERRFSCGDKEGALVVLKLCSDAAESVGEVGSAFLIMSKGGHRITENVISVREEQMAVDS